VTVTDTSTPLDFSGLEDRVRSGDPDTSWAAAQRIDEAALSQLKRDIITIVRDAERRTGTGLTDDEIYDEYRRRGLTPRSPQRIRTSRHEITDPRLCQPPYLRQVSEDGHSNLGNGSQVWGLAARS
jgi:hypothetical protein